MKLLVRTVAVCVVLAGLLSSCSMKKNTAATRQYTAFITRYNIYFNGDEHYHTTLKEMEQKYEDDYNRLLFMHPAEARTDEKAPQPTGDFKRSIEKAQKAIQLRSIKKRPARKSGKGNDPEYKKWLKREEYNPFLHNAWMMMARSQYMNGDFLGAASTFFYISKHFTWLPTTVAEAKLWQARCYCAVDWLFEAESILTRIKEAELTNSTLKGLYAFTWADYYVRSRMWKEAVPQLLEATKYAKGSQKVRLNFLLGQVYQKLGDKAAAYEAYRRAGSNSNTPYRTRFNARIKQSEVFEGDDISKEVKSLQTMIRQGSNSDYLDQIYYAIGNLYLSRGDTTKAVDNYRLAIAKSKRQAIDKALAEITLGRIYFAQGRYNQAQPCYSAAISQLPTDYPDYTLLKRQSDVLDELAVYSQSVVLQDSLLDLSKLPPDEQMDVAKRLANELIEREKREEEDRKREDYLAEQAARGTGLTQSGPAQAASTFVMNTDNSWYFYNEATRNAGRTEFQKRWGTRRLEDDWRRRNKATFSYFGDDADSGESDSETGMPTDSIAEGAPEAGKPDAELVKRQNDPHFPEYYLAQIPKTDSERQNANDVIRDGLFNMGLLLKDKLADFPAAEREFDQLMTRYPDNPYRLEVYNNLFLMYLRQGDMARAEQYRADILREFPDSKISEALRPADYATRFVASDSIQNALYDRAYQAYMANRNAEVHEIYSAVRKDFPLSRIMPKFMFINALSYVTENKPDAFAQQLKELVADYPDVDVAPLASDYLHHLAAGRKLNSSAGSNLRGMVWSTRLSADSAAMSMSEAPAEFDFQSTDTPQYLVLLYETTAVVTNQLLFDVARFNFNSFTVRDFDLETLTFGQLGMIIVKGFKNVADVERYRTMMERSDMLRLPKAVVPVIISQTNFDILLNQGRSFEEYFDATGDERLKQTHEQTLPSEEYPTAAEMYDTEGLENVSLTDEEKAEEAATPALPSQPAVPTPAAKPGPEATPAPKPTPKEFDVPIPEMPKQPAPKPQRRLMPQKVTPAPAPKPAPLPSYPEGSEGDDPLFH